jgi:3-hydroxyacyl-CoA dehydrogenase/3a,7a,12a-trihydroxy-5b-cholest-24-enoyl-CoA hydratase
MSELDWDLVMKVHLKGSFSVARAAWNIMREKGYGRIINTGSSSGQYGSFGQVNYATAKMGVHGFSQSLAKEGEKRNIKVNTIIPVAGTRMTETVMPKEVVEALKPDYVAPLVLFLAHESCPVNGGLIDVGAGYIGVNRWQRSKGVVFRPAELTPENIQAKWDTINDFTHSTNPTSNEEIMAVVMDNIQVKTTPSATETKPAATAAPKKETS